MVTGHEFYTRVVDWAAGSIGRCNT
jgi:hypothetical protein